MDIDNAILSKNTFETRGKPPGIPKLLCDVTRMLDADWSIPVAVCYIQTKCEGDSLTMAAALRLCQDGWCPITLVCFCLALQEEIQCGYRQRVTVSTHAAVHSEALEVVPAVVTGLTILNAKTMVYELASCDKMQHITVQHSKVQCNITHHNTLFEGVVSNNGTDPVGYTRKDV